MTSSIDLISSASNPLIKMLRGLDRKKVRSETGLFLAEGGRLLEQALVQGWDIETVIVSNSGLERPMTQELISRAAKAGARIARVPDQLASTIARKDNPQAVLGAIRQRKLSLDQLDPSASGLWLGLHEIRDPGNLGTILRTADCAGLAGVILIGTCCDPFSVEAVRASMGSIFDIPLARSDFDTFDRWRQTGALALVAASVNGSVAHTDVDFTQPSLILMGTEQSGLPDEVEAKCDTRCIIPMRGGADSLNLAQASAILVYEAWRQRGFA